MNGCESQSSALSFIDLSSQLLKLCKLPWCHMSPGTLVRGKQRPMGRVSYNPTGSWELALRQTITIISRATSMDRLSLALPLLSLTPCLFCCFSAFLYKLHGANSTNFMEQTSSPSQLIPSFLDVLGPTQFPLSSKTIWFVVFEGH